MPAETRPHRGFFLVLDGPDGGGKTTQASRLSDWLRERGFEVVRCRDPGGTPLGDRLRAILLDRETVNLSIRAEMLLYMASRAQLVEEVIRPALEAGRVVVSDRFLLATIVYQGFAGGPRSGRGRRRSAGRPPAGLLPDLTLVLDVPPEAARRRVGRARDRIEDRPADYRERVREGFLRRPRGRREAAVLTTRRRRRGRRDGRPRHGLRADPQRGGACPGTRSAVMTGSSTSCGRASRRGGCRMRCCSSVRRGSASAPSRSKLAQALLCERARRAALDPCGGCPGCLQVEAGTHPDFLEVRSPRGQARAADQGDPRPLRSTSASSRRRARAGSRSSTTPTT